MRHVTLLVLIALAGFLAGRFTAPPSGPDPRSGVVVSITLADDEPPGPGRRYEANIRCPDGDVFSVPVGPGVSAVVDYGTKATPAPNQNRRLTTSSP